MNSPEVQALVEKARESLEVAHGLVRDEHFDFAASRAYYAMFYVAVALLYHRGKTYNKHSAVISGFGREYAKPGRLDAKFHRWLIDAQDFRNIGDYGIKIHVSEEQAKLVCEWADEFIGAADAFLAGEGSK